MKLKRLLVVGLITIGMLFPLVTFYIERKSEPYDLTVMESLIRVSSNQSFLVVCSAPIVFIGFALILTKILDRLESEKINAFNRLVENKKLSGEIKKQKEMLESILDKSPVSYIMVSKNGVVEYVNPSTKDVYGSADTLGINLFKIESLKGSEMIKSLKIACEGKVCKLKRYVHTSITDGKTRIYNIQFSPIANGRGETSALMITEDISKEVKLYEDMRRLIIDTFESMSILLDAKDKYTRQHSQNVAVIVEEIISYFELSEKEIDGIRHASKLHDIGKVGIPESILNKKGKLTEQEYALMKTHPLIGCDIVRPIDNTGLICELIVQHHERYDGTGYPNKIKGNQINPLSQMLAIADVIDALASKRSYKKPYAIKEVFKILEEGEGSQFNPEICSKIIYRLKQTGFLDEVYPKKNDDEGECIIQPVYMYPNR